MQRVRVQKVVASPVDLPLVAVGTTRSYNASMSCKSYERNRAGFVRGRRGGRVGALLALIAGALLSCSMLSCSVPSATPAETRATESHERPARDVAAPSSKATPPFFEVEGGRGAKLALLGTIHVGPEGGWSFPPEIERTIADASAFVLEVDPRAATEERVSQGMMRHGLLPGDTPLSTVIAPETARLIEQRDAWMTANGLPGSKREALQPWLISMILMEGAIRGSNFGPEDSVESRIMASRGSRPLTALETVDEQLAFFAGLPIGIQELMLQDTLENWETASADTNELVEAWRSNDQAALMRMSREGVENLPGLNALYDVVLDGRNRNWIAPLTLLLEEPERTGSTIVVAVGALHLAGPKGVPSLLREAGYRVRIVTQPLSQGTEAQGTEIP